MLSTTTYPANVGKALCVKLMLLIMLLALSSGDIFAQVSWTKHQGNPVLTGGTVGAWNRQVVEASVLYNDSSSRFEMWFGATSGNPVFPYQIGFAVSNDGLSWNIHPDTILAPGSSGEWDSYTIEFPFVIRENNQYKMWYSAGGANYTQYKIGLATSADGIHWTKYAGNPIFEAGTEPWEAGGVMACAVMPVTGGYKMWYTGLTTGGLSGTCSIGYANSTDGIAWQRDTVNNPVLVPGNSGQWDDTWVLNPEVLFIDDQYYLWYTGTGNNSFIFNVGLATSPDGINWHKHQSNPVLQPSTGQWDGVSTGCGSVLFIGDSLSMYYHGEDSGLLWQIGLATSSPFVPVSIRQESIQPTEFALEQNYPNPFNPNTNIEFQIPNNAYVTLKIYNLLGEEVASLVSGQLVTGSHSFEFNASDLASGIYYYRLETGNYTAVKKMILLK